MAGWLIAAGIGAVAVAAAATGPWTPEPAQAPELTPAADLPRPAEDPPGPTTAEEGAAGSRPGSGQEQATADPPASPHSPETPTPPALRSLTLEESTADLTQGERLLAGGDLAAARLFFQRLAEAGDPRGTDGLARSRDPAYLATLPVYPPRR